MDALSIRPAADSDATAIGRLVGQLGYPGSPNQITPRLKDLLAHPPAIAVVAETPNGTVVGVATAHIFFSLHKSEPIAWLTSLVVEDDARGTGVGSTLLAYAERWAVQNGANRLTLTSAHHRRQAHQFYERRGYEMNGVRLSKQLTA
ncbi:MAG: GNAT family N-acetyltransferase [Gemmatimonadaceae bacterium]